MTGIYDSTTTTTPDSIDLPTIALTNQNWWNEDDFPYNAPWWLRYPASAAVFYGAYWSFFEWEKKASWILGSFLLIIGLGLARELLIGVIVAIVVGLVLWAFGAAVAALPVSIAIIIGAMIIAQAIKR